MESNEKKEIKEEMKTKEENETTVKEKQNEEKTKENETIEVENEDKKAEVEEKKQEEDNPEEKDALKEEIKEQYKIKSSNKKTLIILISAIILVIAIFASTGFALFNINNTKIISNISIEGIDVSKLSKKEAEQKISDA